jgi:hypothetical protein
MSILSYIQLDNFGMILHQISKESIEAMVAPIGTVEMFFRKYLLPALYYTLIVIYILSILKKSNVADVAVQLTDNALSPREIGSNKVFMQELKF